MEILKRLKLLLLTLILLPAFSSTANAGALGCHQLMAQIIEGRAMREVEQHMDRDWINARKYDFFAFLEDYISQQGSARQERLVRALDEVFLEEDLSRLDAFSAYDTINNRIMLDNPFLSHPLAHTTLLHELAHFNYANVTSSRATNIGIYISRLAFFTRPFIRDERIAYGLEYSYLRSVFNSEDITHLNRDLKRMRNALNQYQSDSMEAKKLRRLIRMHETLQNEITAALSRTQEEYTRYRVEIPEYLQAERDLLRLKIGGILAIAFGSAYLSD